MAVLVTAEVSGLDESNYEEIIRLAKQKGLDSPKGCLYHVCFGDRQALNVIEVFESKMKFAAHGFKFGPVLKSLGVDAKPHVHSVYNIIEDEARSERDNTATIVVNVKTSGMDSSKYDSIIRRLDDIGMGTPGGRLYHVCYGSRRSLRVMDVFDSGEKFDAFSGKLMPILEEMGVEAEPEV